MLTALPTEVFIKVVEEAVKDDPALLPWDVASARVFHTPEVVAARYHTARSVATCDKVWVAAKGLLTGSLHLAHDGSEARLHALLERCIRTDVVHCGAAHGKYQDERGRPSDFEDWCWLHTVFTRALAAVPDAPVILYAILLELCNKYEIARPMRISPLCARYLRPYRSVEEQRFFGSILYQLKVCTLPRFVDDFLIAEALRGRSVGDIKEQFDKLRWVYNVEKHSTQAHCSARRVRAALETGKGSPGSRSASVELLYHMVPKKTVDHLFRLRHVNYLLNPLDFCEVMKEVYIVQKIGEGRVAALRGSGKRRVAYHDERCIVYVLVTQSKEEWLALSRWWNS